MKLKKILFRADGDSTIGLGHLYRLFALVEMVKETYEFQFLTHVSSTISVIPEDYPLITIPEEVTLENEPKWFKDNFNHFEYLIIADGYQFVSSYQKKIKATGFHLIYIDDLVKEHMYADLVINHSSYCNVNDFIGESYTNYALGTRYAMLRPSFLKAAKEYKSTGRIDTAFISFGGADKFNFSLSVTKVLIQMPEIKKIYVVLGAAYQNIHINKLEEKFPERIKIFRNLSEMDLMQVMKSCNVAIVPTSTVLYELLSVKMPIISGYFVNNQKKSYQWFKEQNCFYGIDDFCKFNFEELKKIILKLSCLSLQQTYIDNQTSAIDGNQKERFLKLINNITK